MGGSHRNLKAWQHTHRLAVRCAAVARTFPVEERYGLASQLRRAAFSAALTIAEGFGRRGAPDFRRFMVMARGSLDEVEAALELARDGGYLDDTQFRELEAIRDEAARTLYGLIASVNKRTP